MEAARADAPPVSNVFHSCPQQNHLSSLRGVQPHSGHRMRGPDGSRLFSFSTSRSGTSTVLRAEFPKLVPSSLDNKIWKYQRAKEDGGSRTAVPKQRNESQNRHSNPSLHFAPVLPLVPERHSAHPRRSQQIWSISYRRYETNPRFSSRYTGRECENEINQATLPACCYPIYAPNQVVFRARSRLILIDSLTPFVPVGL
jgi:hypothetical protein